MAPNGCRPSAWQKLIGFSLTPESLLEARESWEWPPDTEREDEAWLTVVLMRGMVVIILVVMPSSSDGMVLVVMTVLLEQK